MKRPLALLSATGTPALAAVAALVALGLAATAPPARADKPELGIEPKQLRFGRQPFGSFTKKSFTITNQSSEALLVTVDQVEVWDDFSPGQIESSCPLGDRWLAPGESCDHVVGFQPSEFFAGREISTMRVTAHDAAGALVYDRTVALSGHAVAPDVAAVACPGGC